MATGGGKIGARRKCHLRAGHPNCLADALHGHLKGVGENYGSDRHLGGSGHVGAYLVPALVERGHEVVNVSRRTASPYRPHPDWKAIEQVVVDRKAEEAEGKFGSRIAGLNADIVIDMISFKLEGTLQLSRRCEGRSSTICSAVPFGCMDMQLRSRLQRPTVQTPSTPTGSTRQRSRFGFCSSRALRSVEAPSGEK